MSDLLIESTAVGATHMRLVPLAASQPAPRTSVTLNYGTIPAFFQPVTRLTSLNELLAYANAEPPFTRPPKNSLAGGVFAAALGKPSQGITNTYSKISCVNQNGTLALMTIPNGFGVWDLVTGKIICVLAGDDYNPVADGHEPRWSPLPGENSIVYWHGTTTAGVRGCQHRQDVLKGVSSDERWIEYPDGWADMDTGQEYDISQGWLGGQAGLWAQRFQLADGSQIVAVVDLAAKTIYPGTTPWRGNAAGVTCDGRRLFLAPEQGAIGQSDGYCNVDALKLGPAPVIEIPTPAPNNFRSAGHSAFCITREGHMALWARDNRADEVFVYDFDAATYTLMYHMGDLGTFNYGEHAANTNIPGWVLVTYEGTPGDPEWMHGQACLLELCTNPRIIRLGTSISTFSEGYYDEFFAGLDMSGHGTMYFACNWMGASNLDVYSMPMPDASALPAPGTPLPIPTPIPVPDPSPTPIPSPQPEPSDELSNVIVNWTKRTFTVSPISH